MKHKILLLLIALTSFQTFSQTTYTFNGIGDWTNVANWSSGNYPGTTVDANEIVEIYGKVTIALGTTITNNGSILSGSNANNESAEVSILGGFVNNKTINFSRAIITVSASASITTNATSEMIITNSSKLNNFGSIAILGGTVSINSSVSSITNDGTGTISNSGALKVLSGTFENKSTANNSVINNGLFQIDLGNVINKRVFFNNTNGNLLVAKTFTNESTGSINNSGVITVTGFGVSLINSGSLINNNKINLEDSSKLNMATSSSVFTNEGDVLVSSNSTIENNSSNFSLDNGIIKNAGTINNNSSILINAFGELENNGTLNNNFGAPINNFGRLSGINTVHSGSFTNGSYLSPGNRNDATGLYKLDSFFTSYIQTATGSLDIDLAGNIAGDNYDQLIVNRDATLNGNLFVTLLNGFEPAAGDVFTILREGRNLSGTFANVYLPTLSGGKVWNAVEYNNTDGVRISVSTTLSVSDFDKNSLKVKIYPNPAQNVVNVEADGTNEIELYDTNGRSVIKKQISENKNSIDISSLSKGIYMLKVSTGNSIGNFKIIKQ